MTLRVAFSECGREAGRQAATDLALGGGGGREKQRIFEFPWGGGENEAREHGVMATVVMRMCTVVEKDPRPWLRKCISFIL